MGDGNFTNCIRYFPTQAFNLAFKDSFKKMFPKYNPKTEFLQFFGANLVSGGLAAAGSLTIVYPLDYARTRLASDVGSGKKSFSGLGDCLRKTAAGPGGFFALYTGFGVSVVGIVGYRGLQLGTFDTITNAVGETRGGAHLQGDYALLPADRFGGGPGSGLVQGIPRKRRAQRRRRARASLL